MSPATGSVKRYARLAAIRPASRGTCITRAVGPRDVWRTTGCSGKRRRCVTSVGPSWGRSARLKAALERQKRAAQRVQTAVSPSTEKSVHPRDQTDGHSRTNRQHDRPADAAFVELLADQADVPACISSQPPSWARPCQWPPSVPIPASAWVSNEPSNQWKGSFMVLRRKKPEPLWRSTLCRRFLRQKNRFWPASADAGLNAVDRALSTPGSPASSLR